MKKFLNITKKVVLITLSVIILIIIVLNFFLSPKFVEKNIKTYFQKTYHKKIYINVTSFNIFTGLELKNIIIYNNKEWQNPIFIKIDKLRIKYNLLSLFLLKLNIKDISIINPTINIEYSERLKKWNFSYLIKPSKTEKKENTSKGKPFKFHIVLNKFFLKNFSFEMIKNNYIKIRGINIYNKFDLSETSLKGINKFIFKFYTDRYKNIIIRNNNSTLVMPLNLYANINIKKNKKSNIYINYFLNNQLIEIKKRFIKLPKIKFLFNGVLDIKDDTFKIAGLSFFINKNPLINLKADIKNLTQKPLFTITTQPNYFQFNSISNLLRFFLGDSRLYISGKFFTSALHIEKKSLNKFIYFSGIFKIQNFNFIYPLKNIALKKFNTSISFKKNNKNITTGFLSLKAHSINIPNITIKNFNTIIKSKLYKNKPKNILITMKNININDGILNTQLTLKGKENISGSVTLNNLNLYKFNKNISGELNIKNNITGNINKSIFTTLQIFSKKFKFNYIKDKKNNFSKNIKFNIFTAVKIFPGQKNIYINKLNINISDFFYFDLIAKILKNGQTIKAITKNSFLDINNLINKLPTPLKSDLPFNNINSKIFNKIYFSKKNNYLKINLINTNNITRLENDNSGFIINGFVSKLNLRKKENKIKIDYFFKTGSILNKFVEYNTNFENGVNIIYKKLASTINLDTYAVKNMDDINIKYIAFNIPDVNLSGKINGHIEKKDINMNIKFRFTPITNIIFMTNIYMNGKMILNTKINSFNDNMIIKGNINFQNFNVVLKNLKIKNINGYIPYTHIVKKQKELSKDIIKESALKTLETLNYPLIRLYKNRPDNFSIDSIYINNLKISDIKFALNYERNIIRINKADFSILDGSITINKSYFDTSTKKFQFNMELTGLNPVKLKKINLKKNDDTKIYANMRLKGKGFDIVRSSEFYASMNITHIGSELASKFLKALDPAGKDSKIKLVRNALEKGAQPQLMTLEVQYGLLYSKIWIEESTLYKYFLFMIPRLPPSPIIFERKSIEAIFKGLNIPIK